MNDFIKLMHSEEYKRADTEAHDDAKRRHEERVARNTAPENTRAAEVSAAYRQKARLEREARGVNEKPSPQQIRDSITKDRTFAFDHEVERRARGHASKTKQLRDKQESARRIENGQIGEQNVGR